MWKIGELAKRAGLGAETVRYYEKVGVLPPAERAANGYRLYDESHLKRLAFVKRSRELGFSLERVRSLLSLADDKSSTCRSVRALAEEHLEDVRKKIADLQAMERVLAAAVAPCPGDGSTDCPILETLFSQEQAQPD